MLLELGLENCLSSVIVSRQMNPMSAADLAHLNPGSGCRPGTSAASTLFFRLEKYDTRSPAHC
jgi:hypothetical protein